MVFMKYVLSKTGLFPKWEPQVSDVLEVALDAHEVKRVTTPRGAKYFYVIPAFTNREVNVKIIQKCRANGILLRPHYSAHYNMTVYRVRDRGQQFMRDVTEVSRNADVFQDIMLRRETERANKKYILRELFGKYGK
jgi:hypothetical protein